MLPTLSDSFHLEMCSLVSHSEMLVVHIPPGTVPDMRPNAAARWMNTPPSKAGARGKNLNLKCGFESSQTLYHVGCRNKVLPHTFSGLWEERLRNTFLITCSGLEMLCSPHEHSWMFQGIRETRFPCLRAGQEGWTVFWVQGTNPLEIIQLGWAEKGGEGIKTVRNKEKSRN